MSKRQLQRAQSKRGALRGGKSDRSIARSHDLDPIDQSSFLKLQQAWFEVDVDNSGTLERDEIRAVLQQMGWDLHDEAAAEGLDTQVAADSAKDGPDGVIAVGAGAAEPASGGSSSIVKSGQNFEKIWNELDEDGSGEIDFTEFSSWVMRSAQIFRTLKIIIDERISVRSADAQGYTDGDQLVDLDELVYNLTQAKVLQDDLIVAKMREETKLHRVDHKHPSVEATRQVAESFCAELWARDVDEGRELDEPKASTCGHSHNRLPSALQTTAKTRRRARFDVAIGIVKLALKQFQEFRDSNRKVRTFTRTYSRCLWCLRSSCLLAT